MQSLIPALYPMLKEQLHLDFTQVDLITLACNLTASLLQPAVGVYTDRRQQPYSLAVGMALTLAGLILLAVAGSYITVVVAAALIGSGSAVFHPEASRVARLASGVSAEPKVYEFSRSGHAAISSFLFLRLLCSRRSSSS